MDMQLADAAVNAFFILFEPSRLAYVLLGVLCGILLAVIPGLGGLVGIALLLPFTFSMDPYTGIAFLLGVITVMSTSDTIPAVLFGVPGTPTSMATVLDGYPMARRGEGGRALGAAFTASVIGGIIGGVLLFMVIPVLIPVMMRITSVEMLAFCVMGLAMIAALSGGSMLRGLTAAAIGVLIALVGQDSQTATMRWTFDLLYLWDGVGILVVALGLYALPELADLYIKRDALPPRTADASKGAAQGFRDTISNMPLVARSSGLSAILGAIPALGPAVIPWMVYSLAASTAKDSSQFGKGDVRGVIASESSNNATVGGSLLPTIALGIPGSAPMALLIGALMLQGVAPGPDMLGRNLDLTLVMIWTIILANVVGGILAFGLANRLAEVVRVPPVILVPIILSVVFIGALQSSRQWEDLVFLMLIGAVGWTMKHTGFPRAPLILAFVLAPLAERYFHISMRLHGWAWVTLPIPAVLLGITALSLAWFLWRRHRGLRLVNRKHPLVWRPKASATGVMALATAAVFATAWFVTLDWPNRAAILPQIVLGIGTLTAAAAFVATLFDRALGPDGEAAPELMNYDLSADLGGLETRVLIRRSLGYVGMVTGLLALGWTIGILPALFIFLPAALVMAKVSWRIALPVGVGVAVMAMIIFGWQLNLSWPVPKFALMSF